jgi:hypothetical protein
MNIYSSWHGSTEPDCLSGYADFTVGGKTVKIQLQSFRDYSVIASLLDDAITQGKLESLREIRANVVGFLEKMSNEIS